MPSLANRPVRRLALAAVLAGALAGSTLTSPTAAATATRHIDYHQWTTRADFASGKLEGVRVDRGKLRLDRSVGTLAYDDPHGGPTKKYVFGRWTSPWSAPGFGLTEMVPSWHAQTPGDTWVQIRVRGRTATGSLSGWDTLARWSEGDATFHRTSDGSQTDDLGSVATDTWRADPGVTFTGWQVRVSLFRKAGTTASPVLHTVGAMTSQLPDVDRVATSRPGVARGVTLRVPRYSQMTHAGHYPQFGGGGEAWCSPTSASMVLGAYGELPSALEYSWVTGGDDRFVDHAARMTYDYAYRGTGNWAFTTAYAANRTGAAFVTRLASLRQAERFIAAGIPVIASVAFGSGGLTGAPIRSTNGHLLVIRGFTQDGDVVVNDPAAPSNTSVRRVYDRGQFENAWLPTSGGLSYIVHSADRSLPARGGAQNW